MNRSKCISFIHNISIFSIMLVLFVMPVRATNLDKFISDGDVKLNVEIKTKEIVVKQQVVVEVEVLSITPFSEELVLPYLDITNAVVKKDEQKVVRSTRTIGENKWFSQKARYYVYPMVNGEFSVPKLTISIGIKRNVGTEVKGSIHSVPQSFIAKTAVTNIVTDELVVSPNAEFSFLTDRPLTDEFEIGHAITATYTLSVENSHMMLLPDIYIPDITGVELYRKPAIKENVFNRLNKSNTAIIKQEVTLIVQKQGKIVLPKQSINWWDTEKNQLESLMIEKQTIQVGDSRLFDSFSYPLDGGFFNDEAVMKWLISYWYYIAIGLIFFVSIIRLVLNHSNDLTHYFIARKKLDTRKLGIKFCCNVENKNYQKAAQNLYVLTERKLSSKGTFHQRLDPKSVAIWNKLLALGYSENPSQSVSLSEAKALLEAVNKVPKIKKSKFVFKWDLN